MKKLIFIGYFLMFFVVVLCTSCDSHQSLTTVCDCEEKKELKDFIQNSIKNANNMSDEEMEDVIFELKRSGIEVICHKELIWYNQGGGHGYDIDYTKQKIDSCKTIMHY